MKYEVSSRFPGGLDGSVNHARYLLASEESNFYKEYAQITFMKNRAWAA